MDGSGDPWSHSFHDHDLDRWRSPFVSTGLGPGWTSALRGREPRRSSVPFTPPSTLGRGRKRSWFLGVVSATPVEQVGHVLVMSPNTDHGDRLSRDAPSRGSARCRTGETRLLDRHGSCARSKTLRVIRGSGSDALLVRTTSVADTQSLRLSGEPYRVRRRGSRRRRSPFGTPVSDL